MEQPYQQYFGETQQHIRQTARKFVETAILPHIDDWEERGEFPRDLYRQVAELGMLGLGFPEIYGGTPADVFCQVAMSEEFMRAGSGGLVASLFSHGIGLPPVLANGSEPLKQRIIPPVLAGNKISALAITEPSGGSDVAAVKTRAVREGDYYRVNGSKTFITSGDRADYYTVAVRTGEDGYGGISLLVIDRDTPGFSCGKKLRKMGWWCSDTAELFFDDCLVPVENRVGEENHGFYYAMGNFQMERLNLAIMANMTSELALGDALDYVKERRAFGKRIGDFQVIRHRLAEMATQLEASREYTYRIAARINAGESVVKDISMAKNFATRTSDFITHQAVQIFGGMGFMRETRVERLYRDNRILSIGGGTYEIMNEIISKELGV